MNVCIKYKNGKCYYFDHMMRVIDIDFNNILLEEKTYKKVLLYDISYKVFIGKNPLCIRFDKIVGFIKVYSGIRCLVLLEYNEICDKIKCLISEQSDITDNIDCNFAKIRIDSHKSLPIAKILIFYNAIILIKSVVNELKINYYTIFSENDLFKDKSNTGYFQITVCTL